MFIFVRVWVPLVPCLIVNIPASKYRDLSSAWDPPGRYLSLAAKSSYEEQLHGQLVSLARCRLTDRRQTANETWYTAHGVGVRWGVSRGDAPGQISVGPLLHHTLLKKPLPVTTKQNLARSGEDKGSSATPRLNG